MERHLRITILQHEPEVPPGYLLDWANARGHEWRLIEVPSVARWPELAAQDVIVSLGSDRSVHASREPWIPREIEFVRAAHGAGLPVLGICFGSQLLAQALGGRARRAPVAEADWRDVETRDPSLVAPGPWFRWHEDMFDLPPGARLLAGSETKPLAFVVDSSVGLQFHPEVDQEIVESWIAGGREQIAAQGIDERDVRTDIVKAAPGAHERALSLFDQIAQLWTQRGERGA